ncbi:GNAT family N-acetyltransferase [Flavobacterium johnsoniae]|nr:GNAT family N-acetyltransferase [Flavobacterium johnsoniae]
MLIVKYTPLFKENCIEIFKSNLPKFFAPEELELFKSFLDQDTEDHYYVIMEDNRAVGCGGIFLDKKTDEAGLSWGMVHNAYHLKGIGKILTEYRINLLKKLYPSKTYKIDTSQHTAGFYEKKGFRTVTIIPDGFGKGIDQYVMKMDAGISET